MEKDYVCFTASAGQIQDEEDRIHQRGCVEETPENAYVRSYL